MKNRLITTLFLLSSFPTTAVANFGNELSFEELTRICIEDQDPNYMSECNGYGFDYETLETTVGVTDNGKVSFNTDVVIFNGRYLKKESYNFIQVCSNCGSEPQTTFLPRLVLELKESFQISSNLSSFSTKRTKINGEISSTSPTNNNGSTFSDDFKNFAEGMLTFAQAYERFLEVDDNGAKLIIVQDENDNVIILAKIVNEQYILITDFRQAIHKSDDSISFTGNMSPADTQAYLDIIDFKFMAGGGSCHTVWSGVDNDMVAQTVCF